MKHTTVRVGLLIVSLVLSSEILTFAQVSCTTLEARMSTGSKDTKASRDVYALQLFLVSKGYLSSEPTGYFGGLTKKAVVAFQKDNSIDQTGIVGPYTRAKIRSLSCSSTVVQSSTTPLQLLGTTTPSLYTMNATNTPSKNNLVATSTQTIPAVITPKTTFNAYQAHVDGKIQIDASSVTKEYAQTSCQKLVSEGKGLKTITCTWGGALLYSSSPLPVVDPVGTYQGPPFVNLLISPTSVPYQGGYSSFELKSSGMKSCTLYYKDEPSTKWILADSSLGTNYILPGYSGMTRSRSYYVACTESNGTIRNSDTVMVQVGQNPSSTNP